MAQFLTNRFLIDMIGYDLAIRKRTYYTYYIVEFFQEGAMFLWPINI